jgi:hypothetical protein
VPQRVKIDSGGSGRLGTAALKVSILYGALTHTFFTEDTNLSTKRIFAQIISATYYNPWVKQVKCVIFGNISRAVHVLII